MVLYQKALPLLVISFFVAILFCMTSCGNGQSTSNKEEAAPAAFIAEKVFVARCAQCHQCDANLSGPSLKGVFTRWEIKDRLIEFVRTPMNVISKDGYAKALYEKWGSAYMPPNPDLTDEQIEKLLQYCK